MHRKIKVALSHGMGSLLYLIEADHKVLEDIARDFRLEEGRQKTASLEKFNGQKWLGDLPLQIARAALELLVTTRQRSLRMLRGEAPRGHCTESTCRCPIYTQFGLICARRLADKLEADLPVEKSDIHEAYYLDRDLSLVNPLLAVRSPKKVTATKDRPRDINTFAGNGDGIFESRGKAVMGRKTTSNTTNLDSKAGDKTRATTASVQRINSAFEHNDTTLQSLDDDDARGGDPQQTSVRRDQQLERRLTKQAKRQPRKRKHQADVAGSASTASPAASRPSTAAAAKKQRIGATRTIYQLPQ